MKKKKNKSHTKMGFQSRLDFKSREQLIDFLDCIIPAVMETSRPAAMILMSLTVAIQHEEEQSMLDWLSSVAKDRTETFMLQNMKGLTPH